MNTKRVLEKFPMPISQAYRRFLRATESSASAQEVLDALVSSYKNCMLTVGALLFGNHRFLNLKLDSAETCSGLGEWVDQIYRCIDDLKALNLETAAPGLLESLNLHKEPIQKLLSWTNLYNEGDIKDEDLEIHMVTFQYLLDNLLSDLVPLSRHRIIYIMNSGDEAIVLHGVQAVNTRLFPSEFRSPVLADKARKNTARVCFFNSSSKIIFPLSGFMEYNPENYMITFPAIQESILTK